MRKQRKTFFWQLLPSHLLVAGISLLLAFILALSPLRQFLIKNTEHNLHTTLELLGSHYVFQLSAPPDAAKLREETRRLSETLKARVTVVSAGGEVLADSHAYKDAEKDYFLRPEIAEALQSGRGLAIRYSRTLGEERVYVAKALYDEQSELLGVVRLSTPLHSAQFPLRATIFSLLYNVAGVLLVAAIVALFLSYRISRPLRQLRDAATSFAQGDLTTRMPLPKSSEVASLAEAFNQMAKQLNERINSIRAQRNELDAVLSSMMEGVIALDMNGQVININSVAAKLFEVEAKSVLGRPLEELIRSSAVSEVVERALHSTKVEKVEITSHHLRDRVIEIYTTRLVDSSDKVIGALAVLNDITRLRRLENVRSDFVANVSHELRTPITAIQGFVETLLDGALESEKDARRFLEIVSRQAERMRVLIEDLLLLSKLEEDLTTPRIKLSRTKLLAVLQAAVEVSELKAEKKEVKISVNCAEDLEAEVNSTLLEQAVLNLIDNAVKYSEAGSLVEVTAAQQEEAIVISVRDYGSGIKSQHLSRIFERFYRVDRARSRELGGTGLGLALVKHIAQLHRGEVTVTSTPEKGSEFFIKLPV